MIAEDDPDLRRTIELWFEGYDDLSARTVADGERAAEELDDADVLVCDRRMPGLSGPELVERTAATEGVPVVVVSAYEPDEHLGEDDVARYIEKPLDRGEVADAVRDVLD